MLHVLFVRFSYAEMCCFGINLKIHQFLNAVALQRLHASMLVSAHREVGSDTCLY